MSTQTPESPPAVVSAGTSPVPEAVQGDLRALRANWFWFLLLGIVLMALGIGMLGYTRVVWATVVTSLVFGCFLLASGVIFIIGAFSTRFWGGFFLSLLAGVLNLVVGVIFLDRPLEAAILYTLLLAMLFIVEGLFRIVAALTGNFHHRLWMLLNGLLTLVLGIAIWRFWPLDGIYMIGLFVGVYLIVSGASYVGLGLAARRLPAA